MPLPPNGLSLVRSLEQGARQQHPPPSLCGPRRQQSEQAESGRRLEGEQVADEEVRRSKQSVDNNGDWLWQEWAVDGAMSE